MSGVGSRSPAGLIAPYPYLVNNFEDGDPLYVGKVQADGNWLLERFSTTTGIKDYANRSNNTSTTSYGMAWTNRAALTYGGFETLTGV